MRPIIEFAILLGLCFLASSLFVEAGWRSKPKPVELNERELNQERKAIDPDDLFMAFKVIDAELRKSANANSFGDNYEKVKRLIAAEMKNKGKCSFLKTMSCVPHSIDYVIMINALLMLKDFLEIPRSRNGCTSCYTDRLAQINLVARDPIGRKLDHGVSAPILLPRIDHLIFEMARQRAGVNLPTFLDDKEFKGEVSAAQIRMRSYLDEVLDHRLRKSDKFHGPQVHENMIYGHNHLDAVFMAEPKTALKFVEEMPHGVEEDEVGLLLSFLEGAADRNGTSQTSGLDRRGERYSEFIVQPCTEFVEMLKNEIYMIDFDLRFKQLIAKNPKIDRYENDLNYHKHRSHFAMCQKLINERARFEEFLSQETSDE